MEEFDTIKISSCALENLTGTIFSRLKVVGLSPKKSGRKSYWVCLCECGNKKVVRSDSLKKGMVRSCGCLKREQDKKNLTKHHRHKESKSRLHNIWIGIKKRCNNMNDDRYGGRGIRVCEEWMESYEAFRDWSLKNGYSDNLTIERKDNDKGYYPENCSWIPQSEQAMNRRSTVWIEWDGKRKSIKQWSDYLGINYGTLHSRYYRSKMKPPELFEPVK